MSYASFQPIRLARSRVRADSGCLGSMAERPIHIFPTGFAPSICAARLSVPATPVKIGIMNPGIPEVATRTAFREERFCRALGEAWPHGQYV